MNEKKTKDTSVDLQEIQQEFNALQLHLKKILQAGGHFLKEQGSEKAGQPLKALESQMQKNPVVTVLTAFAGGVIIGKLISSCRKKK